MCTTSKQSQKPIKLPGGFLVGAILLGVIQGYVSHALHRVWSFSTSVSHWHVADHVVHDLRGHVLRPLPRSRHQSHPESWLLPKAISWKGKKVIRQFLKQTSSLIRVYPIYNIWSQSILYKLQSCLGRTVLNLTSCYEHSNTGLLMSYFEPLLFKYRYIFPLFYRSACLTTTNPKSLLPVSEIGCEYKLNVRFVDILCWCYVIFTILFRCTSSNRSLC